MNDEEIVAFVDSVMRRLLQMNRALNNYNGSLSYDRGTLYVTIFRRNLMVDQFSFFLPAGCTESFNDEMAHLNNCFLRCYRTEKNKNGETK